MVIPPRTGSSWPTPREIDKRHRRLCIGANNRAWTHSRPTKRKRIAQYSIRRRPSRVKGRGRPCRITAVSGLAGSGALVTWLAVPWDLSRLFFCQLLITCA